MFGLKFCHLSRRGGQALSPHGEEAYKKLIYVQACNNRKPGARRNFVGCEKSLNAYYDIQSLKMQKAKQLWEGGGGTRKGL